MRSKIFAVRLSPEGRAMLKIVAKRHGQSMSEYARKVLYDALLREIESEGKGNNMGGESA
jgi:plasmid stability protein